MKHIKTILLLLLLFPLSGMAQQKIITIQKALELAKQNYPAIKAAKLNIQKQKTLKASAFDFGVTSVSAGEEEVKNGKAAGVINFSISQADIDILGIAAKRKYRKSAVEVAEAAYRVTQNDIELLVRNAFNNLLQKKELLEVYRQIDTVYTNFEKSAELRYKTEETSKLALLSAKAKHSELKLKIKQLQGENEAAVTNLNQYLWIDEPFTVAAEKSQQVIHKNIENNSELILMQQQLKSAEREWKMERAGQLPKFSVTYQNRKAGGVSGYYSYEAGISIPLFNGTRSRSRAAKTQMLIEQENLKTKRLALKSELSQKLIVINNLREVKKYYIERALPLANEQINASRLAYRLGEINYLEFIQSIESSLNTKIDYINANAQYRIAIAEAIRLIGQNK